MRVKLGDIAKINGQSVGNKFPYSKMKYLDTSSITKGIISNIQEFEYPSKDIPSRAQRVVKDKTIIYSTVRPRLCHFGILLNPDKNLIVSTGFVTIDVDEKIADPIYIYNILRDNKITDYLGNIADTAVSSYPSISSNDLRDLEIDILEDLEEQKQIGNFLLSIDKQINTNNEINAELESMAKTLYDYWFLQFEFPNENGKPYKSSGGKMVWNEELKREIPEGWEVKKVLDCSNVVSGYPFKTETYTNEGKYNIYTIGNVQDGYIDNTCPNKINFIPKDLDERCVLRPLDIIMSLTGNVGRVGLVYTKNALLNQRVLKVIPFDEYRNFLYLLFRNSSFINVMQRIASGTSQKNLSPNQVCDFTFAVPNKEILDLFNKKINGFMEAIVNNLTQNQELALLRDFLLPLLMNGQVTFKEKK